MKKRFFTLIEVLIALSVSAILITIVFSFFQQTVLVSKKIEKAKMEIFARQHFQIRLAQLFSHLTPQGFYTEKEDALVFHFDNGIDPQSAFRGPVKGRLFLKGDQVLLKTESLEDSLEREEILVTDVRAMNFAFSFVSEASKLSHKQSGWETVSTLSQKRSDLPAICQILLEGKTDDTYTFFLKAPSQGYPYVGKL